MIISDHPGSWQFYVKRPDNIGLSILEIKQKYIKEEFDYFNQLNWLQSTGGSPFTTPFTTSTLLYEPFTSTTLDSPGIYNLPTDWVSNSFPTDICVEDPNDFISGVPVCDVPGSSGGKFLIFNNTNAQINYITTKAINTIGKTNIKVLWNAWRDNIGLDPILQWSINGTNWNTVSYTQVNANGNWSALTPVSLPSNVNNQATLYLRLSQNAILGLSNYYTIDDFKVTGES